MEGTPASDGSLWRLPTMGRQPESRPKGQGLQGLEGLQWEQVASQSAEQGSQRQDGEAGFTRMGPGLLLPV